MADDFDPDAYLSAPAKEPEFDPDTYLGKQPSGSPSLTDKLMQTWPVRAAKGLYNAVTLPGDVMAGKFDVAPSTPGQWSDSDEAQLQLNNQGIAQRTTDLAGLASPVSAAARAGEGLLGAPMATKPGEVVAPTNAELKSAAVAGYEHPDVKALRIRTEAGPRLADEMQTNLNQAGIDENLAPKTFSIIGKLNKTPEEGEESFLTVDNLRSLRRTLGNAAGSIDPTERLAAKSAQQHVDEFLSDLPSKDIIQGDPKRVSEILADANSNYAAMKRSTDVDQKVVRAQLRASAANSGMNVANTIRQRIADILVNPKLQRGYSADELDQMKSIVEGTKSENAMRMAGNILGGGGGGLSALWGVSGLATHGITSLAPIAGYTLRKLSNAMAMNKADSLSETLRSRSALGEERRAAIPNIRPSIGNTKSVVSRSIAPPAQLLSPGTAIDEKQDVPGVPEEHHAGGAVEAEQGFAQGGSVDCAVKTPKHTKAQADYKGGSKAKECSQCCKFIVPRGCKGVSGTISPHGVCKYFVREE